MTEQSALHVEVVFALPEQQEVLGLEIAEGATVAQAIEQSGIAARFPDHDLSRCAVGVWGQVVERDRRLRDGDRVELYRPLLMDPQEARRELAAKGKSMGKRPS
ncbi:MAG TPA: RnfH family protein [Woeseiaceae bacterium]|nr:RnfH family protein [Woeseiaceae bacterium]